jgi:AcrR family transcriptional regulator
MSKIRQLIRCLADPQSGSESAGARARVRARDGDEKKTRRQTILNAADTLFAEQQELANIADVAVTAGLAKGTIYLYFQSKEEMYLALHLRHVEHFFSRLIARLKSDQSFPFSELQSLVQTHILGAKTYLPLGACCIGFGAGAVPSESRAYFQSRLTEWLVEAGNGLERHFPKLPRGEGVRLLKHSYAIMVGLHSLLGREPGGESKCPPIGGMGSFQEEAALALMRYWAHVAGIEVTPITSAPNPHRGTAK